MTIEEDIQAAQLKRKASLSRAVFEYQQLEKVIKENRACSLAADIILEYPELRYMSFHVYESWGVWEIQIEDLFDKDGITLDEQEEIRYFILNEVIDFSDEIIAFAPYSGKKIDLLEMSLKDYA